VWNSSKQGDDQSRAINDKASVDSLYFGNNFVRHRGWGVRGRVEREPVRETEEENEEMMEERGENRERKES
jgi:hypothetical protein